MPDFLMIPISLSVGIKSLGRWTLAGVLALTSLLSAPLRAAPSFVLAPASSALAASQPPTQPFARRIDTRLVIVSETGQAIAGASVDLGKRSVPANRRGIARLARLKGPSLAVVRAPGYLSEPVIIGQRNQRRDLRVRLWSAVGGKRYALHSSGDVMFGRRYNVPTEGEPLIPEGNAGPAAAAVVEPIRRAFAAADLSTINLETVISRLPDSAAYPGKRFILNSWP
jgi:hypothetical protein